MERIYCSYCALKPLNMTHFTKFFFVLFITLFGLQAQAQVPAHELGLRVSGLNDLGFIYKHEKKANRLTRYRIAFSNIGYQNDVLYMSAGFAIGHERRHAITPKLNFIHGIEPAFNVLFSTGIESEVSSFSVAPSLGYVLGFQYNINDNFNLALETIPSLSANLNFVGDQINAGFNLGFNSNAVALTLAYRFAGKQR